MKYVFPARKALWAVMLFWAAGGFVAAQPVAEPHGFLGAELAAGVSGPGILKVVLQVFYRGDQTEIPVSEKVSVFEREVMRTVGSFDLKKEQVVELSYPPTGGNLMKRTSATCVRYSAKIELGLFRTSYDLSWAYAGITETIHNVDLKPHDALVLNVAVTAPMADSAESVPMLRQPPALWVSSNTKQGCPVTLQDADDPTGVRISFGTPMLFTLPSAGIPRQSSVLPPRPPYRAAGFKTGYAAESPGAAALAFDPSGNTLAFDRLPRGKYLLTLNISGQQNQKSFHPHQAVFIVESVQ